jgi:hypothetical protein
LCLNREVFKILNHRIIRRSYRNTSNLFALASENFSNIVPEINTVYFILKNRTVVHEAELEDTKDVNRIRISKKNRQPQWPKEKV